MLLGNSPQSNSLHSKILIKWNASGEKQGVGMSQLTMMLSHGA